MSTYAEPSGAIRITIDSSKVFANNTFVLMPFNGSGLPSDFWDGIDPNNSGTDFYFTTLSGNVMPHDVVSFDHTNSGLLCWIKQSSVSTTQDTDFLIQWGDGTVVDNFEDAYKNLYGGTNNCTVAMNFEGTISGSTSYFTSANYPASTYYYRPSPNPEYCESPMGSGNIAADISLPHTDAYDYSSDGEDQPFTILSMINRAIYTPMSHVAAGYDSLPILFKDGSYYFGCGVSYGSMWPRTLRLTVGPDTGGPNPPMISVATSEIILEDTWYNVAATYDGSTNHSGVALYKDGVLQEQTSNTNGTYEGLTPNANDLYLNNHPFRNGSPSYYPGRMAYVIMMQGALSSGDIRTFEGFLTASGESSITVSGVDTPVAPTTLYPTVITDPADITKAVGDYHTFTVEASGATSYQWQKNNANIFGATNSGYFIPYITSASAGDYRVSCGNVYGSVYSNEATLTVQGVGDAVRYGGSKYFISGYLSSSSVDADDLNVPVPLGGSGLPTEFWQDVYRLDGKDIVVTDISGVPMYREIVKFNRASKELVMWVRFPRISETSDTEFLIQYGSTGLNYTNDNVWTDNYSGGFNHRMVAHFNSDNDSSAYGGSWLGWVRHDSHLQIQLPLIKSDEDKFDKSLQMNYWPPSPMRYAYSPNSDALSFTDGTNDLPMTIRTWLFPRSGSFFDWDNLPIIQKGKWAAKGEYAFGFDGRKLSFYLQDSQGDSNLSGDIGYVGAKTDNNWTTGLAEWYHFAATYDGDKTTHGSGVKLWDAGVERTTTRVVAGNVEYSGMGNRTSDLDLGRYASWNKFTGFYHFYALDVLYGELFMLNGELNADQMKTQHKVEDGFNNGSTIVYDTEADEFITDPYVPPDSTDVPSITQQIQNTVADVGDSVTFSVQANGAGTLTYFWRHNAIPIVGQSQPNYTISSVAESDAGLYTVGVYNDYGIAYSEATLTVVSSSGIVPDPTGVIPDPDPSGEITPDPSGDIPSGIIVGLPSGYVFISKDFTGHRASDATNIYNMNIGNLFYADEKKDRFLFGSLIEDDTQFYLYVSGVNSDEHANLTLSTDDVTYKSGITFTLEYDEIKVINLKYNVDDNPKTGYGTLLIGVGEVQ